MKILKIAFKNINSLRGEHEIDFTQEPFLQNSLFAITGPTGSGKTTILDVISLALFNHVPRLGKMSTNEVLKKGAILTRNQEDANAQITYQCNQGIFTSRWEISTNRNGNLRDYHMELINTVSDEILDLKKSDVPGKNEELIGLNYDQFIKSVVLAQGEFAKFLQVPKKERGALLEKITGTDIYRRIGMEVFLRNKERAKEIDAKRAKIETFREQLLDEETFTAKQKEAETLAETQQLLKQTIEQLTKEIELKKKLQAEEGELQKAQKELSEVLTFQENFEKEKGEALKHHEAIQLFAEELNQWQSLQEKQKEKQVEITKASEALETAKAQRETLKQQISEQFKLTVTPTDFSEKMERYKAEVRALIDERNALRTAFETSKNPLQTAAKDFDLHLDLKDIKGFEAALQEKYTKAKSAYAALENRFDLKNASVTERLATIQSKLKNIRAAEKAHTALNTLEKQRKERSEEHVALQKQQAQLPEEIKQLKQQIELKEAQRTAKQKTLEVEQLQKQLEDYRKDLKNDEPCPLCGSLDHPYAAHIPQEENGLKAAVLQLEQELKTLNKELATKESSLQQFTQQTQQLEERIKVLDIELNTQKTAFDEQFKKLMQAKGDASFNELEQQLEQQERELNSAEKLQQNIKALGQIEQQTSDLKVLLAKGKKIATAISEVYSGKNFEQDISQLETSWNRNEQTAKQQHQLLNAAKEAERNLAKKLESLTVSLLDQLKDKGYASIEDALQKRLNAATAQTWKHELEQIKQDALRLKTLRNKLIEEIQILKDTVGETPLEALQEEHQKQTEAHQQNEHSASVLSRQLLNHKDNLEQIKKLQKQIDQELESSKHWQVLFDLIGDSKGDKFNNFAQDLTLQQLLQLANKRLMHLTDRYQIDQPAEDEDDSLVAIDEHMGGQRRSIKTLSGGETFILSLALALALSDLASRNIEINSLFIDEGFGTLDPETLDQTLDTLEVLQAESSKMIGVISHVDSLKERIATQIQLTQNGQGYSTLKVV
ncbi:MAG: SbcC/MukB-like Walker B domain-containing protein [Bacteroidota bacterium]|nr:SbcC/MukB-like Walker B domain-containing protein [Bacteroidota bacterium]